MQHFKRKILYSLSILLLQLLYRLAALFGHKKARHWVLGRRQWRAVLQQKIEALDSSNRGRTLWIHVSSLGEFEQGRPIIEAIRKEYPDWRIVLSFFSPSGYEVRKNYPLADVITYLPADTQTNARDFLQLIKPDIAIFVKYDFWYHYLSELKRRNCPTLLVSALFRPTQPFFQWYGGLWREMLHCFSYIFVQNRYSAELLSQINIEHISIAGDTRVDRVIRLAAEAPENKIVAAFTTGSKALIAGSTWPADEQLLKEGVDNEALKLVIAPHEPSPANVSRICRIFETAIPFSECTEAIAWQYQVLVIDNVGMLNTLYQYGHLAYIGGGFGKGIHNTLEPAAYGLPILFGPEFEKFEEAKQFVQKGAAFVVYHSEDLTARLEQLEDRRQWQKSSKAVVAYLQENQGATETILDWIKQRFFDPAGSEQPKFW